MTSATERIRALLDERGVEYVANDGEHVKETCWSYMGELTAAFAEYDNGTTRFACDTWCFTPEQAIAATLGSCNCTNDCTNSERTGTCHIKPWKMERDTGFYDCMECECGYVSDVSDWAKWHFCPNYGARVVEPTTNDVDAEVTK